MFDKKFNTIFTTFSLNVIFMNISMRMLHFIISQIFFFFSRNPTERFIGTLSR